MNVNKIKSKISGNRIAIGTLVAVMIAAMLAMTGGAMAQTADSGDVEITVEDNSGNAVGNVSASLYDSDGNLVANATTDSSTGVATFSNISYGNNYTVEYQNSTGSTVSSDPFDHQSDTTLVNMNYADGVINSVTGEANTYELDVSVFDTDNNTVENVTVTVTDADGNEISNISTDANGDAIFSNLTDGDYVVEAEYVAENEDGENVTYTASESVAINGSSEAIELTLTEEKDVVSTVTNTAGNTWADLVDGFGAIVAGIIVFIIAIIVYFGLKAIGGAVRDDEPQP